MPQLRQLNKGAHMNENHGKNPKGNKKTKKAKPAKTPTEEESLAEDGGMTQQRKWPIEDPAKLHKHKPKNKKDKQDDAKEHEMEETDVIYPKVINQQIGEEEQPEEQPEEEEDNNMQNSNNYSIIQPGVDPSCPPLFTPSDSISATLPPFSKRLSCNTAQSISNHPAMYFTAFWTILIFCYCAYFRKHKKFKKRHGVDDSKLRGEYSALDTVYDELLDDFDNEDLSSYLNNDDDDDSVGTIISQWSEGGENGFGGSGKVELTNFNDGHLSLREMNG